MLKWAYSITYNFTKKTLNEKMPGDVLDLGWVYKHAKGPRKGPVLILSHLAEMLVRMLMQSFMPKTVQCFFNVVGGKLSFGSSYTPSLQRYIKIDIV